MDRGLPGHREAVPQIPDLIERGKLRVERFHKKFNDQLADNTFIAGETFSVADITTITVVDFGQALEMQIPESGPHVRRWYDQVQERESVASRPTCRTVRRCRWLPDLLLSQPDWGRRVGNAPSRASFCGRQHG